MDVDEKQSRPSRRIFNQGLAAAGAGAVIAATALPSRRAHAEQPKRGGHLRIASYSQSANDTLDPAKGIFANDFWRCATFYNGLTRLDTKLQAVPDLAESWEAADGGKRWSFRLKKDVTFHVGKTLDATDVVYSLMRHQDPKVGSTAKAIADDFTSVKADGKDVVIVELKSPNVDLPIVLGTSPFMIISDGATDFSTDQGTGPYQIKEFKQGIRTIGIRNDKYHRPGAYVDSMELFGITDAIARVNALLTGDADIILKVDPNAATQIEQSKNALLLRTPSATFVNITMQMDAAPFTNNDLRTAIKFLFDRERLLKTTLRSFGVLGNDTIFHPDSIYCNKELPQRALDVDRARSLIQKAGMTGKTLDLHVSEASNGSIDMGLMLQQTAPRAGLNINLRREPADGYWSNIWGKRAFYGGEWNARPVYDMILSLAFLPGAAWNESHVADEGLAKLIVEARGTLDQAKRKQLYGEVQKTMYETSGYVIPAFEDFVDGTSGKVKGIEPVPIGYVGGMLFAETVWMDT
jgi:peptide/nickel transport system substrate-binding protein